MGTYKRPERRATKHRGEEGVKPETLEKVLEGRKGVAYEPCYLGPLPEVPGSPYPKSSMLCFGLWGSAVPRPL